MEAIKPIGFRGTSLRDLKLFPESARREAGHQLDLVQHGHDPDDWKPMTSIGSGVREIRIHDISGAYRVVYIAKFSHAVYVLHCFQKKSQKTSSTDIEVANRRYRELILELRK